MASDDIAMARALLGHIQQNIARQESHIAHQLARFWLEAKITDSALQYEAGHMLLGAGMAEEASACYALARIALDTNSEDATNSLANEAIALKRAGRIQEALHIASFAAFHFSNVRNFKLLVRLAAQHAAPEITAEIAARAVATFPDEVEFHLAEAKARAALFESTRARKAAQRAWRRGKHNLEVVEVFCQALLRDGLATRARVVLDSLTDAERAHPQIKLIWAATLLDLRCPQEARAILLSLASAFPHDIGLIQKLQDSATTIDQLEDVRNRYVAARAARPAQAKEYWLGEYEANMILHEPEAAIDALTKAGQHMSDTRGLAQLRCIPLLNMRDYKQGLPALEARFNEAIKQRDIPAIPWPRWDGESDVKGVTFFVYPEQGAGDSIQFVRFLYRLKADGAVIHVNAPKDLRRLLSAMPCIDEFIPDGPNAMPQGAPHATFMGLAFAYRVEYEDVRFAGAYLRAEPQWVVDWQAKIQQATEGHAPRRKRIGIAWGGNPRYQNDRKRSTELAMWESLLRHDCDFISLCVGKRLEDLHASPLADRIIDLSSELHDYADTAGLLMNLDLVISTDTSVAHLAGALGLPTWVLLIRTPDWRWGLEGETSNWYESLRLFRQTQEWGWSEVFARVDTELTAFLETGASNDG